MTIMEAVEAARLLEPCDIPTEILVGWLSDLDQRIFAEVITQHAPYRYVLGRKEPEPEFQPYDPSTSLNQVLLVEDGYAGDVYSHYLAARINQMNGDMERYDNSSTLYNAAITAWKKNYTRNHMPAGLGRFRF